MNQINLLPKIPFVQKYFVLLLALVLIIVMALGAGVTYLWLEMQPQSNALEIEIKQITKQIEQRQQTLQADPLTIQYERFANEVDQLLNKTREWTSVWGVLLHPLPDGAKMTYLSGSEDGFVTLRILSEDSKHIAEYTELLRQHPIIEEIKVRELLREKIQLEDNDEILYPTEILIQLVQ